MKVKEPRPHLPKVLYKYRDISNPFHLETLKEQTIYLSSAYQFNDPFDCKIPLEFLNLANDENLRRDFTKKIVLMYGSDDDKAGMDEQIERAISNGFLSDIEYLTKAENEDIRRLNEEYGIYSMSALSNNLLMWSHYAKCHTGICIGFNAKKLYEICKFDAVGPVTYFEIYPNMSLLRDNQDLFYNQLYNKSIDWYYENEYRYVKLKCATTKIKFPADIIEEIYIGCMATEQSEQLIKDIRREQFPKAHLYKFTKSKKGYFLDKNEIRHP